MYPSLNECAILFARKAPRKHQFRACKIMYIGGMGMLLCVQLCHVICVAQLLCTKAGTIHVH